MSAYQDSCLAYTVVTNICRYEAAVGNQSAEILQGNNILMTYINVTVL